MSPATARQLGVERRQLCPRRRARREPRARGRARAGREERRRARAWIQARPSPISAVTVTSRQRPSRGPGRSADRPRIRSASTPMLLRTSRRGRGSPPAAADPDEDRRDILNCSPPRRSTQLDGHAATGPPAARWCARTPRGPRIRRRARPSAAAGGVAGRHGAGQRSTSPSITLRPSITRGAWRST